MIVGGGGISSPASFFLEVCFVNVFYLTTAMEGLL
jgi:hypothetical protein